MAEMKQSRQIEKVPGSGQQLPVADSMQPVTGNPAPAMQRAVIAPGAAGLDELLILQSTIGNRAVRRALDLATGLSENRTGLPDQLKTRVESISGLALDEVRVHYHSPKPAQIQALAYTQGTDIHLGPGQEKHLPHEVWHVVQQLQGRVEPNLQLNGAAINVEEGLEREAEGMGERAIRANESGLKQVVANRVHTVSRPVLQGVWKKSRLYRRYPFTFRGEPVQNVSCWKWDHVIDGKTWYCWVYEGKPLYFHINKENGSISNVGTKEDGNLAIPAEIMAEEPSASIGSGCAMAVDKERVVNVCREDPCMDDPGLGCGEPHMTDNVEIPVCTAKLTEQYNGVMDQINFFASGNTDRFLGDLVDELQTLCTHYFFARNSANRSRISARIEVQLKNIQECIVPLYNEVQEVLESLRSETGSGTSGSELPTAAAENSSASSVDTLKFIGDKALYQVPDLCNKLYCVSAIFTNNEIKRKIVDLEKLWMRCYGSMGFGQVPEFNVKLNTIQKFIETRYIQVEELVQNIFQFIAGETTYCTSMAEVRSGEMNRCCTTTTSTYTATAAANCQCEPGTVKPLRKGEKYVELAGADLAAIVDSPMEKAIVEEIFAVYQRILARHGVIYKADKLGASIHKGQLRFYINDSLLHGLPNDPVHLSMIVHELIHAAEAEANFGGNFTGVSSENKATVKPQFFSFLPETKLQKERREKEVIQKGKEAQRFKRYMAAAMNTGLENVPALYEKTEKMFEAEQSIFEPLSCPEKKYRNFGEYIRTRLNYIEQEHTLTHHWHEFPTVITELYFVMSQFEELRSIDFFRWLHELVMMAFQNRRSRKPFGY